MTPSSAPLRLRAVPRTCRMVAQVYSWSQTPGRGLGGVVTARSGRDDGYHPRMAIQDQTSFLRKVYVRAPEAEAMRRWREYGWRSPPEPARAAAEHEAFRAQLTDAGAEVVVGTVRAPDDPDAIYTYDPVLMTDAGAILLRPGKVGRRGEPAIAAADLEAAGV